MKDANAELAKLAKDTPEFLTAKEAVTKMEEVFRAAKAAYDALTKKKNAQDAADEAETQRKARETADATAEAGQKALEKAIEDAGNAITAAESAKTKAQSAVDAFDTDAITTAKTAYDSCADITNETCDAAKEVCTEIDVMVTEELSLLLPVEKHAKHGEPKPHYRTLIHLKLSQILA